MSLLPSWLPAVCSWPSGSTSLPKCKLGHVSPQFRPFQWLPCPPDSSSTLAGPIVCSRHSLTIFPSSSPLFLPLPCCPLLVLEHSRHSPTSRTCPRSSLYSDTLPSESHMTSSLTSFKSELPRDTLSAWPQSQHSSCPFAVQKSLSPLSPADIPCIFMSPPGPLQ